LLLVTLVSGKKLQNSLNLITDLSLPISKFLNAMHTLVHQLNCNFQRSFGGASVKNCLPDATFLKGKAEGSRQRIEQTRSFVLAPFTGQL
jgi:hypothetical protein